MDVFDQDELFNMDGMLVDNDLLAAGGIRTQGACFSVGDLIYCKFKWHGGGQWQLGSEWVIETEDMLSNQCTVSHLRFDVHEHSFGATLMSNLKHQTLDYRH